MIEQKSGLQVGVWFDNRDFYRYSGTLPIVVECDNPPLKIIRKYVAMHGCISCQMSKLAGLQTLRWIILPP